MRYKLLFGWVALCAAQMIWSAPAPAAQSTETRDVYSAGDSRFTTPEPQYPFLVDGDTRVWTARVAFDERGHATEAVIIRSSGSPQLDNTITKWIMSHWKSFVGKPATVVTSAK